MSNLGSPNATKDNLRISGNVVIAGLQVSGVILNVQISGETVYVTTSGGYIAVSGVVTLASGGTVDITNGWSISNSDYKTSSNVQGLVVMSSPAVSVPCYFQRGLLHLNSAQLTSSEFAIYHNSFIGAGNYSTKIFSQNMSGHQDVVYLPSSPYAVFPGSVISMQFTNSGSLTIIMQQMFSINP